MHISDKQVHLSEILQLNPLVDDPDHFISPWHFRTIFYGVINQVNRENLMDAGAEVSVSVIIICCKCRERTHFVIVWISHDWCLIEPSVPASSREGESVSLCFSVPYEANQSGGVRVRAIRQGTRSVPLAHLHVKSPFHPSTLPNCC